MTLMGWTETEEQARARWARRGITPPTVTEENAADLEAAEDREEFMARLERLSNYVDATLDEMERR